MVDAKMREDVAAARKQLKEVVASIGNPNLREAAYNIAIKAYLKGYINALKNVDKAMGEVHNDAA